MSDEQVSSTELSGAAAATTKMAADRQAGDERLAYRGVFQRILARPEIGAAIAALGIWVFFWSVSVPFGKASGASSILDVASSPLGIMAVAVAMLMIGGEFDLSAGAATGALSIVTILMVREVFGAPDGGWGLSLWFALPLSLLAALGLGWFNGTVVEKTALPSFIVTLGSFFVLVGAKLGFSKLIVGQQQVGKLDDLQSVKAYIDNGIVRLVPDELEHLLSPDIEVFEVVPPVIDVIEENLANGLDAFAGLPPSVFESGDRGYGVLVKVFAGEWTRNDHILEGRDWVYNVGLVTGLSLFALALYEMHFRRSDTKNLAALPLFVGGLAVAIVGVWKRDWVYTNGIGAGVSLFLLALFVLALYEMYFRRNGTQIPAGLPVFVGGLALAIVGVWGRDWVYTIGIIGGLSLFVLALYEMHFRRSDTKNLAGLPLFVGGLAVTMAGVWRLHATDSVVGNWIGALIIAAGMLVGFIGWGMWRYQARATVQDAVDDMVDHAADAADSSAISGPLALGLAAFVGAIVVALALDPTSSEKFTATLGLAGLGVPIIALVVGVVAAFLARGRDFNAIRMGGLNDIPIRTLLVSSAIGFIITMLFFDITTEQGARAIFFLVLSGLAAVLLIMAVGRGRRQSQALGSSLLILTAVAVTAMAFFVQSESSTPKFRTQAFTLMILIAALMSIWAVASMLYESRGAPDASADRFGTTLGVIGGGLVVLGLTVRLMFVTKAELLAEIPPATFSVRILWFLLFTIVCSWVLARTRFGSWTFAVGGNKQAARQVGVPAARTKTQLFMLVSAAAWLVGLLLAFRLNNIQANTGDGQEFQYIIAAVVGGTFLTGGYGSTIGAAIGAVIIAMSRQGIPSARWNSDWRFVFVGTILLLAVVANNFIRTKAEAAR